MKPNHSSLIPFHYGWIIVLTGILTVFIALGLGRFALGMLLPAMAETLSLNYAQMGFISTGNFIGYLAAVLLAGYGAIRMGARTVIAVALLLLGLSLLAVSQAESFTAVMLLYFLTGLGSGAANVPIMGLVSHWFAPRWRGKAAGLMVTGNGLAIMFTGLLIPQINHLMGTEGWRTSWLLFGLIAVVGAVLGFAGLRNSPQALGLEPIGTQPSTKPQSRRLPPRFTRNVALWFISQYLFPVRLYLCDLHDVYRDHLGSGTGHFRIHGGHTVVLAGLFEFVLRPVVRHAVRPSGAQAGVDAGLCVTGLAYVGVAAALPELFLYLSFGLFGLCAWSIPSIMAAAAGDYMGPHRAVAAFGTITFFFGIGQIAGPAIAGVIAEASNSFVSSYWLAAVLAAVAIALTALLRKPVSAS
ncbi:MAG: YbfB/YjiJ family MFS transporter [Candidatus Competibacteraceae bacterium]